MKAGTLTIAASVSVLVHVIALVIPHIQLPEDEDFGGKPISAVLLAAPVSEASLPAKKRAPKPAKPRKPAPPIADAPTASLSKPPELASAPQSEPLPELAQNTQSAPQVPDTQSAATQQSQAAVEVASAPVPEAQSPAVVAEAASAPLSDIDGAWSRQGRVRYVSSYYGLPITAEQEWQRDDSQFTASLSGSVPIKGELIKQESSGRIVAGRPVSDTFRETFNAGQYETHFDAAGNTVQQVRKGTPREVATGGYALDMLALMHFMALQPMEEGRTFDVFVVTFRGSVSRVSIEQRRPRTIELPLGTVNARQFHAEARNGSLKIDVWLSVDWQNAPLRIRVEDAGGTYDLKAEQVEINGVVLARALPTPPDND
jgi:hypothetical protein